MIAEKNRFDTLVVQSGEKPCPLTKALRVPIYTSSTFVYGSLDELMKGRYFYTRIQNPTLEVLILGGDASL